MELPDPSKYSWLELEKLGTPYILSDFTFISVIDIIVAHPTDWSVLFVESGKRICHTFRECSVSFYEFLFTCIILRLPLFEFKV